MKKNPALLTVLLLALPLSSWAQQPSSHIRFQQDFDQTLAVAEASHQGDYVLFLFDESEESKAIAEQFLGHGAVAEYINRHFAAYATRVDQPEGQQLLTRHGGGGAGATVVISVKRLNNTTIHAGLSKEIGVERARERFLRVLEAVKQARSSQQLHAWMESITG